MLTKILIVQPVASFDVDTPDCQEGKPACAASSSASPVGANGAIIAALAEALTKLARRPGIAGGLRRDADHARRSRHDLNRGLAPVAHPPADCPRPLLSRRSRS